jgi:hypothetical protein
MMIFLITAGFLIEMSFQLSHDMEDFYRIRHAYACRDSQELTFWGAILRNVLSSKSKKTRTCRVQSNFANSRLTLRMILRSPELLCESLPGFARSEAKTVDL